MRTATHRITRDVRLLPALASEIVARSYRTDDPPLLASVLAARFAELIVNVPEHGTAPVVAWVEQICERYPPPKDVEAMLESACDTARSLLAFHPETAVSGEDISALEYAVGSALARCAQNDRRTAENVETEEVEAAMAAFLAQLDDADPASAEHSRAVALWCKRIARRIDMSEDKVLFVSRCGLLHDVGKTMTPPEVLQAARGLTKEEWVIMRAHTTQGAQMIEDVPLLRPFAPAARWHHERLDGMGYPDRLGADDIPLHIRIVTVADCFNAMIGRRPYRLPMAPSAAIDQLLQHRGTQFDPLVVDAMIDVVERND